MRETRVPRCLDCGKPIGSGGRIYQDARGEAGHCAECLAKDGRPQDRQRQVLGWLDRTNEVQPCAA